MSESFDGVMEEMREKVASPYWINMADRLQIAHEREIAEALCDACDQCDRMDKKAYEHEMGQMHKEIAARYELSHCPACETRLKGLDMRQEIEHASKESFHHGYIAGQRSMNAEHYAVALRLRHLPLDGGSYENLSAIAGAIWHGDFGWTKDACSALRDKIIELLGGVHDEPVSMDAGRCSRGNDCDRRDWEPWRVSYDELGNERRKAVCRLREWSPDEDGRPYREFWEAVMGEKLPTVPLKGDAELDIIMRDRLIHLLGGDEPDSQKSPILADSDGEDGGEVTITDELRECVHTATKQYDDTLWYEMGDDSEADHTICYITEGELLMVADRIDEQFKRICWQQEAVLQKTIDGMAQRLKDADKRLDEAEAAIANWREREKSFVESERLREELYEKCKSQEDALHGLASRINELLHERDELQKRLDRSRAEYCETCEEAETTDILRAKLDAIREVLDGQQRHVD